MLVFLMISSASNDCMRESDEIYRAHPSSLILFLLVFIFLIVLVTVFHTCIKVLFLFLLFLVLIFLRCVRLLCTWL